MNNKSKEKIVVIGAGNVGEAIAYTLMAKIQANDIVLVDVNQDKAKGAAIDIAQATSFHKQIQVRQGGYEECADARIIIITAGIARKPGQTRLELAKTNVSIIRSITESIMKYAENPLIIVVSNPADVMTTAVKEFSGLPSHRVIGSGTSLDTARFRHNISTELGVNVKDVQAYIVGEHGDSQVAVWSSATIGGLPLKEYEEQTGISLDKAEIAEHTKNGGAEVIGLKGATFYGVAMSVSTIVETIINDDKAVLPAAHVLDESFGEWAGVAASLPCRIGWDGIEKAFNVPMNQEETEAMNHSVELLKEFWAQVKEQ
ncbi:L-lactate dehydrogenase [Faecalicatena contorta]|uniref:L-lactate dehydrogenase n=1 Tax=Faecalicatena contorta TaxID=39482 RepID=A0A316A3C9_9FIRM|nr:L-lactate dehydrogenase [Faecalicatena contorta]PWJ52391.1 L-lactate dehydrogenase [Faecalicatena contorta]SUQ12669.1 L-lactate dehydrogenase [Faecalicatena contorta]